MSFDKLNETEIICPSDFSIDENFIYNDSTEKSLKGSKNSSINKSNILLNALKDFSVKYDLDDKNIMNSRKFLLSFNDIISLIKFAIEFQNKINNSLNLKNYLSEISQDFINDFSYYIFSYEKMDINQNNKKNNKGNNNYDTYNSNINNNKNKKQTKTKTSMQHLQIKRSKNDDKMSTVKKNKNENIKCNKSYYKTRNNSNNKRFLSPKSNDKNIKGDEKNNKKRLNKSVERRKNCYLNDLEKSIEGSNKKKKFK